MEQQTAMPSFMEDSAEEKASEGSDQPCHLLDMLPPELRNEIWRLALHHSEGVMVNCGRNRMITKEPLALMMTCKQINAECGEFLFSQNDLRLPASSNNLPRRTKGRKARTRMEAAVERAFRQENAVVSRIDAGCRFRSIHLYLANRNESYPSLDVALAKSPARAAFKACKKHELPLVLSVEDSSIFYGVVWTFDLSGQKTALECIDYYIEQNRGPRQWSDVMMQFYRDMLVDSFKRLFESSSASHNS